MRIIAGQWRGRPLIAPPGLDTRPTSDRAREALFSMLASRLGDFEGLRVADLFAGTGTLGLEALSRGAAHCAFVEQDRAALDALRANIAALGAADRADVRAGSVLAVGPTTRPFDLLLLDPPYGGGLAEGALDRLARQCWISSSAWIVVETAREERIAIDDLEIDSERVLGAARLTLLRVRC